MATRPMLPASTTAKNPRIDNILAKVRAKGGAIAARARQTSVGKRVGATGQRLAARVRERPDSLTGLAANNYGKATAALASGLIDETEVAQSFEKATRVKPSTVVVAATLVTRLLGLDSNHPQLRAATTATLVGMGLPKIRDIGARITKGVRAAAAVPPPAPAASGFGTSGVAGYKPGESETDRPAEGIPGEATLS